MRLGHLQQRPLERIIQGVTQRDGAPRRSRSLKSIHVVCAVWVLFVLLSCGGVTNNGRLRRAMPVPPHYVVRDGDTLSAIAHRFHVRVSDIVAINKIARADQIAVGQKLRLPQSPRLPRSDRLSQDHRPYIRKKISRATDHVATDCTAHGNAPDGWSVSKAGFMWPVDGVVLTSFGTLRGHEHKGLAIGALMGTPVWASHAGRVITVSEEVSEGFGEVVVQHLDGARTLYGGLLNTCVRKGVFVDQGGLLGLVGTSTKVASPRLYFELIREDSRINPWQALP